MSSVIPLLSNVKVAAPCSASWQDMEAVDGDRVHFCGECKKNVYNLSAMTQTQAEGLLREHEGHLCVRYYERTDGTILTQNCPVGQAALRMQMIARSKRAALATVAMASIVALAEMRLVSESRMYMGGSGLTRAGIAQCNREIESERELIGKPAIEPQPQVEHVTVMGKVPSFPEPRQTEGLDQLDLDRTRLTNEQRAKMEKRVSTEVNLEMQRRR